MYTNTIECPNCGAKLKIKENEEFVYCEYCDSQVIVDDGSQKVKYVDEARIKEAELQSKILEERRWEREQELEELRRWQKVRNAWLIALVVMFGLCNYSWPSSVIDQITTTMLSCLIFAGVILWFIRPKTKVTKEVGREPVYYGEEKYPENQEPFDLPKTPGTKTPGTKTSGTKTSGTKTSGTKRKEEKIPWYLRIGWIITLGLFTEGIYWIVGAILRTIWRNKHDV